MREWSKGYPHKTSSPKNYIKTAKKTVPFLSYREKEQGSNSTTLASRICCPQPATRAKDNCPLATSNVDNTCAIPAWTDTALQHAYYRYCTLISLYPSSAVPIPTSSYYLSFPSSGNIPMTEPHLKYFSFSLKKFPSNPPPEFPL